MVANIYGQKMTYHIKADNQLKPRSLGIKLSQTPNRGIENQEQEDDYRLQHHVIKSYVAYQKQSQEHSMNLQTGNVSVDESPQREGVGDTISVENSASPMKLKKVDEVLINISLVNNKRNQSTAHKTIGSNIQQQLQPMVQIRSTPSKVNGKFKSQRAMTAKGTRPGGSKRSKLNSTQRQQGLDNPLQQSNEFRLQYQSPELTAYHHQIAQHTAQNSQNTKQRKYFTTNENNEQKQEVQQKDRFKGSSDISSVLHRDKSIENDLDKEDNEEDTVRLHDDGTPSELQQPFPMQQQKKRPLTSVPFRRRGVKSRQQQAVMTTIGQKVSKRTINSDLIQPGNGTGGVTSNNHRSSLDECFPANINRLAFGAIPKAFCKPINFKFGSQFRNKSEESRYYKISSQVLKLRHLLINDPQSSHEYIYKFLKHFFSLQEISQFTDDGLKNFIHAIIEFKIGNPNLQMRQFIMESMKGRQIQEQQDQQLVQQYLSTNGSNNYVNVRDGDDTLESRIILDTCSNYHLDNLPPQNPTGYNYTNYYASQQQLPDSHIKIQNNESKTLLKITKQRGSLSPPATATLKLNISSGGKKSRAGRNFFSQTKTNFYSSNTNLMMNESQNNLGEEEFKQIMYSPISGKHELFFQNKNIPKLQPIGQGYHSSPRKMIKDYINQQEIRIAYEIEPPSLLRQGPKKDCTLQLLSEIEGFNPKQKSILNILQYERTQSEIDKGWNHEEKQVTSRTYIGKYRFYQMMSQHERLQKSISTINYYNNAVAMNMGNE